MRLMVDAGFPASVSQANTTSVEFWRWAAGDISDPEFLKDAYVQGFQGVIFLGTRSLHSQGLANLSERKRLWVAGTVAVDPFDASRAIANNVHAIERLAKPGKTHEILTRDLREVH